MTFVKEPASSTAYEDFPGGKIIICMPGAPLLVPYQASRTTSTEPADRYLIHMLTGPYSLFRNRPIGNEGYYWLLVKSLFYIFLIGLLSPAQY